jgi:hypothetical protein
VVFPRPTSGPQTPTAIVTSAPTPAPTYTACTPGPLTPTVTPRPTASPTPWTQPTAAPPGVKDQPPVNMSNQAGIDAESAIAVHPTEGWAALVWANWIEEFPDEAVIFVKVQDGPTGAWRRGLGVNTGPVTKGGGSPAILIDRAGRIHVAFTQDEAAVITTSTDQGRTWSEPTPLPRPSSSHGGRMYQFALDAADQLHVLYTVDDSCFDCYHYVHAQRPADGSGAWIWQDDLTGGSKQLVGDLTTVQLPGGTIRTIAAVGVAGDIRLVTQDGAGSAWVERPIPDRDLRISPQNVFWIDTISFTDAAGQARACVSWGQYSQSGVFASCSTNAGVTWDRATIIAYHPDDPPDPSLPTPDPSLPTPGPDTEPGGAGERGYRPELLYEPTTDQLLAVWLFRGRTPATGPAPYYLVYSYRPAQGGAWLPLIDGGQPDPPLTLFGATRRNAARTPRLSFAGSGLAAVTWSELERDESVEVYAGRFNPAALLIRKEGP